ncbi:DUF4097 family beta strand repeat-containing protein [Bowmanella dokdonensis]|uniref:Lipoprotein n=1 Tax=Bowmanella dokdonensis TaxID=751969 RepID=A0A939DK83_9ALTE|nr:hypothetical protein [Bowmanella dokdonensis]MBN7823842.1 hypothetical protein [Bowmanella dokdonensis]
MKNIKFACFVPLLASATLLSGCIIHVDGQGRNGDVSGVFGSIELDEGSQANNLSTVNGGIEIDSRSKVRHVSTVNGGIELGDEVSLASAETVNGGIEAGTQLRVEEDLSTVNGEVLLGKGADVGGSISTVNGDISLDDSRVGRNLETQTGDIRLSGNTLVEGDIVFTARRDNSFFKWGSDETPELHITASASVGGQIILQRPVNLHFENAALHDKVVRRFSRE